MLVRRIASFMHRPAASGAQTLASRLAISRATATVKETNTIATALMKLKQMKTTDTLLVTSAEGGQIRGVVRLIDLVSSNVNASVASVISQTQTPVATTSHNLQQIVDVFAQNKHVTSLPVVDAETGEYKGMISHGDVFAILSSQNQEVDHDSLAVPVHDG